MRTSRLTLGRGTRSLERYHFGVLLITINEYCYFLINSSCAAVRRTAEKRQRDVIQHVTIVMWKRSETAWHFGFMIGWVGEMWFISLVDLWQKTIFSIKNIHNGAIFNVVCMIFQPNVQHLAWKNKKSRLGNFIPSRLPVFKNWFTRWFGYSFS